MIYFLLLLIPFVNIYAIIKINISMAKSFGTCFGIIILIVLGFLVTLRRKQKIDKTILVYQDNLKQYYENNNCQELYCVPSQYRYFVAISYIYECLNNGRASDLKEALNLFEEQMHRWRMEGYQQQTLALCEQQLKVSQAILVNTWFR